MDDLNQSQTPETQGDLADLVDIGNESLDAIAAQQEYAPEVEAAPEVPAEPVQQEEPVAHQSFSALDNALRDIEEL